MSDSPEVQMQFRRRLHCGEIPCEKTPTWMIYGRPVGYLLFYCDEHMPGPAMALPE